MQPISSAAPGLVTQLLSRMFQTNWYGPTDMSYWPSARRLDAFFPLFGPPIAASAAWFSLMNGLVFHGQANPATVRHSPWLRFSLLISSTIFPASSQTWKS